MINNVVLCALAPGCTSLCVDVHKGLTDITQEKWHNAAFGDTKRREAAGAEHVPPGCRAKESEVLHVGTRGAGECDARDEVSGNSERRESSGES